MIFKAKICHILYVLSLIHSVNLYTLVIFDSDSIPLAIYEDDKLNSVIYTTVFLQTSDIFEGDSKQSAVNVKG